MKTPFRHHVPKNMEANLEWRKRILQRTIDDESFIDVLRAACAKDPIFWLNGFCWTYDTRREFNRRLPFILYDYQESTLLEIFDAFNSHDLLIEKSRDMGASWLCVAAVTHSWCFREWQSFLFVSRNEEYVDASGNPKALFWKFDFLLDTIPKWLRPAGYDRVKHRRSLHAENPDNGSVIDGESTTGQVARGDRRSVILLDEFAAVDDEKPGTGHKVLSATRDATPCRLFNSTPTPSGVNCAFYDMTQKAIKKVRLHWPLHPNKAAGLYTTNKDGSLKILDEAGYPAGYKPLLDGKLRSPWYDVQCERAGTPQEIARELDINYRGAASQFFNADEVYKTIAEHARPPIIIGNLEYDWTTGDPIGFEERPEGRMRLWCMLDRDRKPFVSNKIVLGADVAAGTGASNSCLVGYDAVTHEKVFEYVSPYIRPEHFATLTVAVARWFKGQIRRDGVLVRREIELKTPFVIWESNGPGRQFGSKVLELGFSNVYLRVNDLSIKKKVSDIPGWSPTREAKLLLLGEYRAAVESQKVVNRSKKALEETLEYIFLPNGSVVHTRARDKLDPSGANANHGDRVMADALAWKAIGVRIVPVKKEKPDVPVGCLAWRRQMREEDKKAVNIELGAGW